MNQLLEKYNEYLKLVNCTAIYEMGSGSSIEVTFRMENFPHLLGLHKLTDIQLIQFWLDRNNATVKLIDIIKAIKNEKLTDDMVRNSFHFYKIKDRYEKFSYNTISSLSYTDAIINFDKSIAHSIIKSEYLLFEKKTNGYNHMGIAYDNKTQKRYIETFFFESSDHYIKDQKIEHITNFRILDSNKKIIFEDSF